MSRPRVLWVLQHPTPYNVYMLNGLAEKGGFDVEAVFRRALLPSHPWKSLPPCRFPNRVVATNAGRDRELEERALSDDATLFVFGGWRDATILPLLIKRRWARLPHAIWTDTPKMGRSVARRLLNAAFRVVSRRACCVLGTGEPALERYDAIGVPRERLLSLPFIVDEDYFASSISARRSRPDATIRFLVIGRLQDQLKGQSVAINAFAIARKDLDIRIELVLAGTGPDESMLRELVREAGIEDAVSFPGWVGYEDLAELLSRVDALVMPSRWDPYPVAVLEAMAAGLPVLGSTACGSVRERVIDDGAGFRHEPGDVQTLAAQMRLLARSAPLRQRLGEASLRESQRWGLDMAVSTIRSAVQAAGLA